MSAAVTAAVTASNAAAANAARKKTEACKIFIEDFDAKSSSTQQKQEYAACINRLYPQEASINPEVAFHLQIAIWIAVLGFVIGLAIGYIEDGLCGYMIVNGIMFAVMAGAVSGFVSFMIYAVKWSISA